MWRPLGVKSHWENKKQQENQDVETNGGEKPLGKQKTIKTTCGYQWELKNHLENKKNKMWRPMGLKSHWGIKKNQKTKCGDQSG